ncbi:MAG: hypothetical protein V3U57_06450 [Robiginitomaculum sp.]
MTHRCKFHEWTCAEQTADGSTEKRKGSEASLARSDALPYERFSKCFKRVRYRGVAQV